MKFIQHYSSSRNNLYELQSKGGSTSAPKLLLECGVRWPLLLKAIDYNLKSVQACLLTHEHKDHSKAALDLMKNGVPVYASYGTWQKLGIQHRRIYRIHSSLFNLSNEYKILSFEVKHDAIEPLGYIVQERGTAEALLFCPDSCYIKKRFFTQFSIIALEVSYDRDILRKRVKSGDVHIDVAKRIIRSHASRETTLKYLQKCCDLSRCREIHLLHTSGMNLDKRKVKKEFEKKLYIQTIIRG